MKPTPLAARATLIVCTLGVLLHAYTVIFETESATVDAGSIFFLVALFLWSLVPYTVWAAVATVKAQPAPAVGAAAATLASDLYVHYTAFIAPQSSTAALALLFAPLWNLVLIAPIGAAISWPLITFATRRKSAA